MVADTSSIGVSARLVASQTYPNGITLTAFPEDGDLGDSGTTAIGSHASGVNGHLIVWKTANGITVSIPIIPNTEDAAKMERLYAANQSAPNKIVAHDIIQLVVTNPVTGVPTTYKNGWLEEGPAGTQYGLDGRIRSKVYTMTFESVI